MTNADVLPPTAYARRHLPGAINVIAESSQEQLRAALPDVYAPIVTYDEFDDLPPPARPAGRA